MIATMGFTGKRESMDELLEQLDAAEERLDNALESVKSAVADYVIQNGKPTEQAVYENTRKKLEDMKIPVNDEVLRGVVRTYHDNIWRDYNPQCQG